MLQPCFGYPIRCNRVPYRESVISENVEATPCTDSPNLDVPACLDRVRARDEAAARDLVQHLHPLIVKIVRAHLPRQTAEEDLVQMVLTKIFTRLDQFRGAVPFEHWVSRVAVNTCLSELNRQRTRPEWRWSDLSEDEERVVQNLAAQEAELDESDAQGARELVQRVLNQLEPADRLVITLLHLEGKSVDEIRAITGWSRPLVKVRAFRARHKMKRQLDRLAKERK